MTSKFCIGHIQCQYVVVRMQTILLYLCFIFSKKKKIISYVFVSEEKRLLELKITILLYILFFPTFTKLNSFVEGIVTCMCMHMDLFLV